MPLTNTILYGHMAQLGLEHRSPKPNIEGSNPSMPVKYY